MMKLYTNSGGANCRRVAIYAAEKGIDLDMVEMDLSSGALKTEAFLKLNPAGMVPLLQLGDGTCIPESTAIIEYLEELYPEPSLLGRTREARARVRAMERIASDLGVLTIAAVQHSHPFFEKRLKQEPAVARGLQAMIDKHLGLLDTYLGTRPFLAGESFSVADIVLYPLVNVCRERLNIPFAEDRPAIDAWYRRVGGRPSVAGPVTGARGESAT